MLRKLICILIILQFCSCNKIKEQSQEPELESLQHGIKTSAAIAYCTSVVMAVAEGQELPDNITNKKGSAIPQTLILSLVGVI